MVVFLHLRILDLYQIWSNPFTMPGRCHGYFPIALRVPVLLATQARAAAEAFCSAAVGLQLSACAWICPCTTDQHHWPACMLHRWSPFPWMFYRMDPGPGWDTPVATVRSCSWDLSTRITYPAFRKLDSTLGVQTGPRWNTRPMATFRGPQAYMPIHKCQLPDS